VRLPVQGLVLGSHDRWSHRDGRDRDDHDRGGVFLPLPNTFPVPFPIRFDR
jgi:hypothetical protein